MRKILLCIALVLSNICNAQVCYNFDNALTGSYATTKSGDQTAISFNGINHIGFNNMYSDINPYYSLKYTGRNKTDDELLTREDIGIKNKVVSLFAVHQYNSSYIRGISSDNWMGIGIGKHYDLNKNMFIALSYCNEYEFSKYDRRNVENILRCSFRTKLKINYADVQFIFEYYFQPNVNNINDLNIFGSSTLVFFNNKPVSFIVQNMYNYISTDKIKTIQNTTFGFKLKLSKKNEQTN